MSPQHEPDNDKREARNNAKQTTYSKARHLNDLSEIMALRFLKIIENQPTTFTYPSLSQSIAADPQNHKTSTQRCNDDHTQIQHTQ